MRIYEPWELTKLRETAILDEENFLQIKPSPSQPKSGCLDGHELENIQKLMENPPQMPDPNMDVQKRIALQRDTDGFPARCLNQIEIRTRFETLRVMGREVGLWSYRPRYRKGENNRAALVFYHGGGWISGSTFTVENQCKLIAELADAVVFNVDYSLAPEHPFPQGLQDCYAALEHVIENASAYGVDPARVAVAGDSAGGNLASAVALLDRDLTGGRIALQVLLYPVVSFLPGKIPGFRFEIEEFEMDPQQKPMLERMLVLGRPAADEENALSFVEQCYLPGKYAAWQPCASPALAGSHRDLPPALCITAEYDGLRAQTEYYAKQLRQAGVSARTIRYRGMMHAFFDKLGVYPQAEDACIEIADALKALA